MGRRNIFIIDVQGYSHDHSFIIKELTITQLYSENVYHFLVKPPFDRAILSNDEQRCISWLENSHHKIKWEDGNCEYGEVFSDLRKTIRNADIIYVKGSEKTLFIQSVTGKFTIDLDKLDCPKASRLPIPKLWDRLTCSYYNHSTCDVKCSLLQALKFKEWLLNRFENGMDECDL